MLCSAVLLLHSKKLFRTLVIRAETTRSSNFIEVLTKRVFCT